MSRPPPFFSLAAACFLLAACCVSAQTIAPAPVAGPVGLSVGNESRIAVLRAERWLARHESGGTDVSGFLQGGFSPPPDDAELSSLLPLLQGGTPSPGGSATNLYEAWGRLAQGLTRRGETQVFLPDGTSIHWRNAILHALVTSQRSDGLGGGWWNTLPDDDPSAPADALRSTRAAHSALLFLLGEPSP